MSSPGNFGVAGAVSPGYGQGLDLLLEAGDQFPIRGHEGLPGFDLGDDLLLCGEGWERDWVMKMKNPPETFYGFV